MSARVKHLVELVGLFAPAIVLAIWAVYLMVHQDGNHRSTMIAFLIVLALAVVWAESTRIARRYRHSHNADRIKQNARTDS